MYRVTRCWVRLLPWILTFCLAAPVLEVSSLPTKQGHDESDFDQKHELGKLKEGHGNRGSSRPHKIELENICEIQNSLSAFCLCDSLQEQDALDARCTIFNMTDQNDVIWDSFSSQSRLSEVQFIVDGSDGQMYFVPVNAFRHLKALKVLEIREASIDTLGAHTFADLKQLTELKLTRNKVRHIRSYAFQGLSRVTELDLSENALITLERGAFSGLDSLRALYLNSNNISLIEDSVFLPLSQLQELDLSNNAIAVLTAETLLGLRQLKKLTIHNNQLAILGDMTFSSVPQLRKLDLRSNQLKVIRNRAFDGLLHLESLNVAKNSLTIVGPQAVQPIWPNLLGPNASLTMDGNPWRCDCPLRWVSSLSSQSQSNKVRQALKELTCNSKEHGSPIQLVRTVESLECSPAEESSAEEVEITGSMTTEKPTTAKTTVPHVLEDEPISKVQPTLINDSASLHLSAQAKETVQSLEPVLPSATSSTRSQSSGSSTLADNRHLTLLAIVLSYCLLIL